MEIDFKGFLKDQYILKLFNKYRLLLRATTPEDAFQDACLKTNLAIENGRFKGDCSIKTFFIRILSNTLVDALRKEIRTGIVTINEDILLEIESQQIAEDEDTEEIKSCLKQCIKEMANKNPQLTAMMMARHDYENWEIEKIIKTFSKSSKEKTETLKKIPFLQNTLEDLTLKFGYSSKNVTEVTLSKFKQKLEICIRNCQRH
ncbi:hypothetical protein EGI22_14160 [Lacihabitans sp. LS3-19]|uniref:RNA polymerase sigma factor n=1 Tax=Lacihabitans sp. LS3-19 TaxID=2487335 RepID=UPI0020CF5E13|nr:sigma factor [Lacihabitans sp. LS3-19]MCP9769058.1 hypothetical protein [Lacihabitans sp. LS3-19]